MATYVGLRCGGTAEVYRLDVGSCYRLNPCLDIRQHSPTGLEWGYSGSGPAQLALAILHDLTGDAKVALRLYQVYKFEVVAGFPKEGFILTTEQAEEWLIRKIYTNFPNELLFGNQERN